MPRPSGIIATPHAATRAAMCCGSRGAVDQHSPARGLTKPNSARISVDLPAPLWPITHSTSLARSSSDTSSEHRLAAVGHLEPDRAQHRHRFDVWRAHAARSPK